MFGSAAKAVLKILIAFVVLILCDLVARWVNMHSHATLVLYACYTN